MHSFRRLMLGGALALAACGQELHDWQTAARLQAGDRVRLSLKTGHVDGEFHSWTVQDLTVGTVTAKREDVRKIERYRHGGSRGKHVAIGALIGFGGGFAIGASVTGGCTGDIGPCISRPLGGAVAGGAGAVVGVLIGAILPVQTKELIYSAK